MFRITAVEDDVETEEFDATLLSLSLIVSEVDPLDFETEDSRDELGVELVAVNFGAGNTAVTKVDCSDGLSTDLCFLSLTPCKTIFSIGVGSFSFGSISCFFAGGGEIEWSSGGLSLEMDSRTFVDRETFSSCSSFFCNVCFSSELSL